MAEFDQNSSTSVQDTASLRRQIAAVLGQCQWQQAADLIGQIEQPTLGDQLQGRLARNMAAFQRHRPAVYHLLVSEPTTSRCSIVQDGRGNLSISQQLAGRGPAMLGSRRDVELEAATAVGQIEPSIVAAQPIMLEGLGNGYVLKLVMDRLKELVGSRVPTMYVIEPQPEVVLHASMIHDFTGEGGPIAAEHVQWCIGRNWQQQLAALWQDDLFLPAPAMALRFSTSREQLKADVATVLEQRQQGISAARRTIESYYENLEDRALIDLLGPHPSRLPRILLITSRHTTVLQYACADARQTLEDLGWDTRLLIEPGDYQMVTSAAIVDQIERFRPDFVFVFDHLRYEGRGIFPAHLPYLCWIQDELPNLRNVTAGGSVNEREWVLLPSRPSYVHDFGYPPQQCIDLPQLTRIPELPSTWESDGDDLVYVSNASRTPDQLRQITLAAIPDQRDLKRLVEVCCDRLIDMYQSGEHIARPYRLLKLVEKAERDLQMNMLNERLRREIVAALRHPLNDGLYRQQALQWAAAVADELGVRFSLYGSGWDEHPQFARFAGGPVQYGRALEELTRQSKINLRLEPFSCLSHQRMTNGLAAGGFFLSRRFAPETDEERLITFLAEHLPDVQTFDEAMEALDPSLHGEFEEIITAVRRRYEFSDVVDPVESARISQRMGLLAVRGPAIPFLEDISFDDEASLRSRVEQFLNQPNERRSIALAQREVVVQRLSYEAGLTRVLETIRQRMIQRLEVKSRETCEATR